MPNRTLSKREVNTERLRMFYLDWAGDEPPILLLHPNRTNSRVWDFVVNASCLSNRFLAPDQRGHGHSEYPASQYSLDDYIIDDLALLDMLNVDRVILVGAATGGNLSLLLASRYPQRVVGLVVADPGLSLAKHISQRVQGEIINQYRFSNYHDAKAKMPFSHYWSETMREHFARQSFRQLPDGQVEWRYYPPGVASTEAALEQDLWDQIKVACPTLILRGETSDVFPERNLQRLLTLIPHAQSATLANTYHRLSQDAPEVFAEHLDKFVANILKDSNSEL